MPRLTALDLQTTSQFHNEITRRNFNGESATVPNQHRISAHRPDVSVLRIRITVLGLIKYY
jgi:hypothetical protein